MRRHRFRPGTDAVSPVVGVVLLVGIAVMLTGSIAVFVLGFGPGEPTPETEIQFHQEENGNVTVTMIEPAGVSADELTIQLNGSSANKTGGSWSGNLDPGDTVTVYDGASGLQSESEVRVIWESSSGGGSEILGEYQTT